MENNIQKHYRAIIIDDNEMILRTYQRMLMMRMNLSPEQVYVGTTLWDLEMVLQEGSADNFVVDGSFPLKLGLQEDHRNGRKAIQLIRKDAKEKGYEPRVVMVTGDQRSYHNIAKEEAELLTKPVDFLALVSLLQ